MSASGKKTERSFPMRSPVNWTVLGLVIERSSYGFELWKRYERLYGDVVPIGSESNIYAALNVLMDKGLIEKVEGSRTVLDRASRQPKSHYRVTERGLREYETWVITQAREHSRRSLQFAHQLGAFAQQPHTALEILERYEQACLDGKEARIPTTVEFPSHVVPGFGDRLASAYGRNVMAATLGWIEYARREFAALAGAKEPHESA
jgi:DNA-binding PadR family transcriptional regulator